MTFMLPCAKILPVKCLDPRMLAASIFLDALNVFLFFLRVFTRTDN